MREEGRRRFNVELKARLADRQRALEVCERLGARRMGVERQTDTYFSTGRHRMKLRESSLGNHWLIWYHRPDSAGSRKSAYRLISIPDPEEKRRILARAMTVKAVVVKERLLYLLGSVRIHIDRVEGLGDFLEFEAVLGSESEERAGHEKLAELREAFGIAEEDIVSGSYSDLVAAKGLAERIIDAGAR